jgi:purine-binding chemotaxis protein CheW
MELVLFEVGKGRFAFSAIGVSKVLDALPVTPLPYAPADVEGLVNVAGAVYLKVDLAARLGFGARAADPNGNLLVVTAREDTVVVQVDRVFNKISVEPEDINMYDDTGTTGLVRGEFLLPDGMVLLLNESMLGLQNMEPEGVPEGGSGLLGQVDATAAAKAAEISKNDLPTVTVQDGEETYAFHMGDVLEIVEIRELTALPGAGPEVQGLMQLRGTALLVLSLTELLQCKQKTHPRFVLVVAVDGAKLGIAVADIVGIERYEKDNLQAISGGDAQLEGYLPGMDVSESRMTGLVSIGGLISPESMAIFRRYLSQHGVDMAAVSEQELKSVRRLLSFRLGGERCALPLSLVDRVEEYGSAVNLPEGDDTLAGVVQIKGEVAPVLDMRDMLGVKAGDTSAYVVVRIQGAAWALVVDKVERVIEIAERDITPVRTNQNDYLTEVGRLDGELVSLLSLEPLSRAA